MNYFILSVFLLATFFIRFKNYQLFFQNVICNEVVFRTSDEISFMPSQNTNGIFQTCESDLVNKMTHFLTIFEH